MNRLVLPGFVTGLIWLVVPTPGVPAQFPGQSSPPIPLSEWGAKAGAHYQGDGLCVAPTPEGARLRCVFQKLEGKVTPEGLWLVSTVEPRTAEKFRVAARAIGREGALRTLPAQGAVTVADKLARCVRPGLTEEYSVSVDGVRQDFVVTQRPGGNGPLRVELEVTGARAEALVNGARLVLAGSGRKLNYRRMRVSDVEGRELLAHLRVVGETRLAVVVEDGAARYPLRIDPTYNDVDWMVIPGGPNSFLDSVRAVAVDSSGNVYIGGIFVGVDQFPTNFVSKWNGITWSGLKSELNGTVNAFALSGSDLYVGGDFVIESSPRIAKWDGNMWSGLGSGVGYTNTVSVYALALSGSDLYVGGTFTNAGGIIANHVAKWDGTAWSALGSGVMGSNVNALAVSASNLYAGGGFTTAGDLGASNVARWDGNAWSALGSGVDGRVRALAVSGSNVYVGGDFTTAGGVSANRVAKWDGSAWSALGSGVSSSVAALVVSGSDLYAGGAFTNAGGISASRVAKWDGNSWSALGSGMNGAVFAFAQSGSDLYAGGVFNKAGGKSAPHVAKAIGPSGFTSILPDPSRTQALLTYASSPGATNLLLSSTNLTTWKTNATVNATNVTNSVSVNIGQPQEFFRLQRLP